MKGFTDTIKYFYQEFLLRDLLGYVTPGALVIATALVVVSPDLQTLLHGMMDLPVLIYLVLVGLSFATGLAVQNVGEYVRFIRWYHKGEVDSEDAAHLQSLFEFHRASSSRHSGVKEDAPESRPIEWAARIRERIAVKKNLTGTNALGLILSISLLVADRLSTGWRDVNDSELAILGLVGVLILGLLRGHRKQRSYQHIWENIVKSQCGGDGCRKSEPSSPSKVLA